MSLRLARVKQQDLITALDWREKDMASLRTSNFILDSEQSDFYESLKSKKDIEYYSILRNKELVGVCGFVNLNMVNRIGEIAIILNPEERGDGTGAESLRLLVDHGFKKLGLRNIFGESYKCNEYHKFWEKIIKNEGLWSTHLPERKYYDGKYYDGVYFNFKNPNL